jgi:hypothetical protein
VAVDTEFSLENLRALDFGAVNLAFKEELERAVRDCMDRPLLEKPRTVNIRFVLKPECETNNKKAGQAIDCDHVALQGFVESILPKQITQVYNMRPTKKGKLFFNPDVPEDPDQETLYNKDEKRQDEKK